WTSTLFSAPPLLLAVRVLHGFRPDAGFQLVHRGPWIDSFNIYYFVGVDGISITMVVLTALLCFICMIASFGIDKGVKGYYALFLLLETGMLGVFCALDFFLFFVFWELMLLPMYFLIGFAIKVPAFPFHTWLLDAHVEAPTAVSVILAGVLLKMGTYGILRVNYGILPAATLAPAWHGHSLAFWLLAALGTFNIVYGAL